MGDRWISLRRSYAPGARTSTSGAARREHAVDATHVLRLARPSGCCAYDAALAEALAVPLVSADRELVATFPALASSPKAFCERGA